MDQILKKKTIFFNGTNFVYTSVINIVHKSNFKKNIIKYSQKRANSKKFLCIYNFFIFNWILFDLFFYTIDTLLLQTVMIVHRVL